jgi:hypothetical protein
MGSLFFYDQMLPVPEYESHGDEEPVRQLEIFTRGLEIFIRTGPLGDENAGRGRYTARLSVMEVNRLSRALDEALMRIGQA